MEILKYTLDQLTYEFKHKFGKGVYHSSALYREIFKNGNGEETLTSDFN